MGMLNFYRRLILKAVNLQTLLNDLLQGNVKGKAPVNWTTATQTAFDAYKECIARAALLAHPEPNASLAIVCDASDFTVGAALQQRIGND